MLYCTRRECGGCGDVLGGVLDLDSARLGRRSRGVNRKLRPWARLAVLFCIATAVQSFAVNLFPLQIRLCVVVQISGAHLCSAVLYCKLFGDLLSTVVCSQLADTSYCNTDAV